MVISNRLTTEPCVVVADTYGHSSFMDKIQKAQMFGTRDEDNPLSDYKKILEINPHHKVNQIILERINVSDILFRPTKRTNKLKNLFFYCMRLQPSIRDLPHKIPTSSLTVSTRSTPRPWESSICTEKNYRLILKMWNLVKKTMRVITKIL